jgi:hypothetical protein
MPDSVTLLAGGTTATTGGSNQVFQPVGKNVTNGKAFGDAAVSDLTTRQELTIRSRAATYDNTRSTWSKQKVSSTYVIPYLDSEGVQHFSLIRSEMECSPVHLANVSTLIADLREKGAQVIMDAEMDDTWNTGAY